MIFFIIYIFIDSDDYIRTPKTQRKNRLRKRRTILMGVVCGALCAGIGLAIVLALLIARCQYIYHFLFNHKYIFVHFVSM